MKKFLILFLCVISINVFAGGALSENMGDANCVSGKYAYFVTTGYKLIVYDNRLDCIIKRVPLPSDCIAWITTERGGIIFFYRVMDKENNRVDGKVLVCVVNTSVGPLRCESVAYAWIYDVGCNVWQKVNSVAVKVNIMSQYQNIMQSQYGHLFLRYSVPYKKYGISIIDYSNFLK